MCVRERSRLLWSVTGNIFRIDQVFSAPFFRWLSFSSLWAALVHKCHKSKCVYVWTAISLLLSPFFFSLSLSFSFLLFCPIAFSAKKERRINRRSSWKFSFKVWNWNSSVNFANKTKKRKQHTRNKRFTKRWCIRNRRAPKDVNTQL